VKAQSCKRESSLRLLSAFPSHVQRPADVFLSTVLRSPAFLTPRFLTRPPPCRLVFFLFCAAGDGAFLQVRALQDRRQGGIPRHAPLLRHGQPPPPPPG
jgi:hypothetical protein